MGIRPQTVLKVIDNSGAAYLKCITVLGKKKSAGGVGDIIVGSVKHTRALEDNKTNSKVQRVGRGEVVRAVVVRTRKDFQRAGGNIQDGTFVKFDDNACVLVDYDKKKNTVTPKGTRINGAIASELRQKSLLQKVVQLAPFTV